MIMSIHQLIKKIYTHVRKRGISKVKLSRIERKTTVRLLLSGHPWDFEDWPLNRGWPFNRGTT